MYLLFAHFLDYFSVTWMKKANNFQIVKTQPQGLLSIWLIFRQFQLGVAYKSVTYKKAS